MRYESRQKVKNSIQSQRDLFGHWKRFRLVPPLPSNGSNGKSTLRQFISGKHLSWTDVHWSTYSTLLISRDLGNLKHKWVISLRETGKHFLSLLWRLFERQSRFAKAKVRVARRKSNFPSYGRNNNTCPKSTEMFFRLPLLIHCLSQQGMCKGLSYQNATS